MAPQVTGREKKKHEFTEELKSEEDNTEEQKGLEKLVRLLAVHSVQPHGFKVTSNSHRQRLTVF